MHLSKMAHQKMIHKIIFRKYMHSEVGMKIQFHINHQKKNILISILTFLTKIKMPVYYSIHFNPSVP